MPRNSIVILRVKKLLERNISLRSNDRRLIANIWSEDLKDLLGVNSIHSVSAGTLLSYYASGELTNTETIRRARQKLQKEHAWLN